MALKLAPAFIYARTFLLFTNAFLYFPYANAAKNNLRLKQKRALFQREN